MERDKIFLKMLLNQQQENAERWKAEIRSKILKLNEQRDSSEIED
ncbi:hypothetical protein D3OALGA1CA_4022 [Olavius algarvensis associated proteobacterium Delta 3]|nr:hypothetical protein D3OALGB2SA_3420 [Olavius algarvensis associated proteobacterium Delta 3]CAB5143866.1 hypothetical protein D3OALGA1CA_4022 [Olavius algarvensis associated proteobacterium Delta 3]